jgi:hypothetical protein
MLFITEFPKRTHTPSRKISDQGGKGKYAPKSESMLFVTGFPKENPQPFQEGFDRTNHKCTLH